MRKSFVSFAVVACATLAPALAQAQDAAGAEVLFQKGHQLFEQKKYAEACPKFAESFRLDPVTGSLLALASCHEAEGKLASAWAEYIDVAARARREGKNDRADAAQQRAASLEPKLAKVTISLAQGAGAVTGLQIKRDGVAVGPGMYGTALPLDRGDHTVEASAPGREPFVKHLAVRDGASETVTIPVLAETPKADTPAVAPVPGKTAPAAPAPAAQDEGTKSSGSPVRTIGIVAGVVGVVVLGVGGYFGVSAITKNNESNTLGCDSTTNFCTGAGLTKRRDAVSAGNTSTGLIIAGSILAVGGLVMIIAGGKSTAETAPAKTAISWSPAVSPTSAGLAMSGGF